MIIVQDFETGGSARIEYGGLDHIFIGLHLESEVGKALQFEVTIYAYPPNLDRV